jgi:2,3-bisphosphoglycerate-dependent phosphoglycerate mutase
MGSSASQKLQAMGFHSDIAYTSALTCARHTLTIMLEGLGQTGLNKHDVRAKWGGEQVHIWLCSFDVQSPGGESQKRELETGVPVFCHLGADSQPLSVDVLA